MTVAKKKLRKFEGRRSIRSGLADKPDTSLGECTGKPWGTRVG
jgi:hypothetical protein